MSKKFEEDKQQSYTINRQNSLDSDDFIEESGVIDRVDKDESIRKPASLYKAAFKGKKAYLIRKFINSDRVSNRTYYSLGLVAYVIQVTHNGKTWKIYKRRSDFGNLHDNIVSELRK